MAMDRPHHQRPPTPHRAHLTTHPRPRRPRTGEPATPAPGILHAHGRGPIKPAPPLPHKPTHERSRLVIDPVDLKNDGFKQSVKLVNQALAQKKGDGDFSAHIFDDEAVAREALAADPGGPGPTPDQSQGEMKAALDRRGQHLVAIYSGGLQMSLFPYEIDWYPGAFTSTQNVGQFVGAEEWKPQV